MQEQITHVRCPACRSTVRVFDSQCWVCGTDLATTPRDNVVIDASSRDVASADKHGFDAITRRIAQMTAHGARSERREMIPVGPLRTVNERTNFRRSRSTPRQGADTQLLLPSPAARIAHLAPPSAHARRSSAVQPLLAVAGMVFLSVAAMTVIGRYAPQRVAAENANGAARTVATAVPPTATESSSRKATRAPLAAHVSAPRTPATTLTMPTASPTPATSTTPRPTATAARAPTLAATVQATGTASTQLGARSTQTQSSATTYLVKRGDTCSQIARAFKISLASLSKFNKLDARCWLRAGQTLTIPAVQR